MFLVFLLILNFVSAEDFLTPEYASDKIVSHTVLLVDTYVNNLPENVSGFPNGSFDFYTANEYKVRFSPSTFPLGIYRTVDFFAPDGSASIIILDGPITQPPGNINLELVEEVKDTLEDILEESDMIVEKKYKISGINVTYNLSNLEDFENFIDLIYDSINATPPVIITHGEEIISVEEALSKVKGNIVSVELMEEKIKIPGGIKGFIGQTRMVYNVRTVEERKALGLIPTSMNVDTKVDAETGNIIAEVKPWWSFLFDIFKR